MASLFFRNQVTCFLILFVERSGSTYLATMLGEHEDILARREEFAHIRQRGGGSVEQLTWVNKFFTPPIIGRNKAIGFKTKMVDILDPDGFAKILQKRNCLIIQLHRRNAVKAVISTMNADRLYRASGNWNLLDESDRLGPFAVDFNEFERLLKERKDWDHDIEQYVQRLQLPTLVLYYEDMLVDKIAFMRIVFDFIGVRFLSVKGKTIKNTQDDLRQAIINFEELRGRYKGTSYQPMFDEVLL